MTTTAVRDPRPNARRLKIYSFDPALAARYDLAGTSHVTIEVPWEDDLRPGPVGEYVEVIDIDPAAGAAYPPVDLNAPELPPGRYAENHVPRLRIYPHAMRQQNAYYSPQKKALLFPEPYEGWQNCTRHHTFPPIKDALEEKTCGRVLQTDCDEQDAPPPGARVPTGAPSAHASSRPCFISILQLRPDAWFVLSVPALDGWVMNVDLTAARKSSIKTVDAGARDTVAAGGLGSLIGSLLLASPAAAEGPQTGVFPLLTGEGLSAATTTVLTLFLLAVLLESALAIVFNWRPFVESFNARATRPLVSFGIALAFVAYFNFDAVTGLMNAIQKTTLPANWFGYALTAAILAGGSAGVNTMLVALGFRELKTQDTAAPKLDLTQAWVAIRVVQEETAGEVRAQIGATTSTAPPHADLPLAGVIPGSVTKTVNPFRRFFLRDPGRFPAFGGYLIPSKTPCKIVVSGAKKGDLSHTRVFAEPADFLPAKRAIIDLTIPL